MCANRNALYFMTRRKSHSYNRNSFRGKAQEMLELFGGNSYLGVKKQQGMSNVPSKDACVLIGLACNLIFTFEIYVHFLLATYYNGVCAEPVTYSMIEPSQIMLRLIQCRTGAWSISISFTVDTQLAIRDFVLRQFNLQSVSATGSSLQSRLWGKGNDRKSYDTYCEFTGLSNNLKFLQGISTSCPPRWARQVMMWCRTMSGKIKSGHDHWASVERWQS